KPRSLLAKSRGHGCPRDRDLEGVLFFAYFLLDKQKKVGGRQGRRSNSHGREPVFAKRPKDKDKIKRDSGFRRNDGDEASTGMTKIEPPPLRHKSTRPRPRPASRAPRGRTPLIPRKSSARETGERSCHTRVRR